eukprot:5297754-Pyramimonas_sp.AAC.1
MHNLIWLREQAPRPRSSIVILDSHQGRLRLEGATASAARYPRGRHHFNSGFSAEKQARLHAVKTARRKMG